MATTESSDISSPDDMSITTFRFRPDQASVVAQLCYEFIEAGIPDDYVDEIIASSVDAAAKAIKLHKGDFINTDSVLDAAGDCIDGFPVEGVDFKQVDLLARMLAAQVLDAMGLDVDTVQTGHASVDGDSIETVVPFSGRALARARANQDGSYEGVSPAVSIRTGVDPEDLRTMAPDDEVISVPARGSATVEGD